MIISEKQVMQLIRIADAYCNALHRFGKYKAVEEVRNLLATINDQQSEELSVLNLDKDQQSKEAARDIACRHCGSTNLRKTRYQEFMCLSCKRYAGRSPISPVRCF